MAKKVDSVGISILKNNPEAWFEGILDRETRSVILLRSPRRWLELSLGRISIYRRGSRDFGVAWRIKSELVTEERLNPSRRKTKEEEPKRKLALWRRYPW